MIDLSEFRPIPNHPSYLLHADGRVVSLKQSPPRVLAEDSGSSLVWRRVTLDRQAYRVRDLVGIIYGTTAALESRTDDEYSAAYEARERADRAVELAEGTLSLSLGWDECR